MMKRKLSMSLILMIFVSMFSPITGNCMEGDGSVEKPYIITNYSDLVEFRSKVNGGENEINAILASNIDLSDEDDWTPIGSDTVPYKGIFDGKGYAVQNIAIDSSDWKRGFFGSLNGATVKNFGIESGYVNGKDYSASIASTITGGKVVITNCFNGADISGTSNTGGILGGVISGTVEISDCYNVGNVSGSGWGTAGISFTANKITNCHSYGEIKGRGQSFLIGNGTVENCYYRVAPKSAAGYGTKASEEAFNSGEIALKLGDAFGQTIGTDTYPVFRTENNRVYLVSDEYTNTRPKNFDDDKKGIEIGDGTEQNPYIISSASKLLDFAKKVNTDGEYFACAKLTADIDLGTKGLWSPIGTGTSTKLEKAYCGTFDGNGHYVGNISISGYSYIGFFGVVNNAKIINFGIESGIINCNGENVAAICGYAVDSEFDKCWSGANVVAACRCGAIVGQGSGTTITNSYNVGDVTAPNEVSAIAFMGINMSNCYNYGKVSATEGGVWTFGANNVKTNCYYLANTISGATLTDNGGASEKTAFQFSSGEVAMLLGDNFGQYLGLDEYPVAKNEDNEVQKGLTGYYNTYAVPSISGTTFIRQDNVPSFDKQSVSKYLKQIIIDFNCRIEKDSIKDMVFLMRNGNAVEITGYQDETRKRYIIDLTDELINGEYSIIVKQGIQNALGNSPNTDLIINFNCNDKDEIITKNISAMTSGKNTTLSDIKSGKQVDISIMGINPFAAEKKMTAILVGYKIVDNHKEISGISISPISVLETDGIEFSKTVSLNSNGFSDAQFAKIFIWNYPVQINMGEINLY